MTRVISIAPVRKTLQVNASQMRAFEVFTAGIDRWWPKGHGIGTTPLKKTVIEPFKGGRWLTTHEDGKENVVGHILEWDPPSRIALTWEINASWKPDSTVASEVEIRFIAEGANATRVELEHRRFESLGQEGGEKMRKDVDGGWVGIMDLFKQAAEG